MPGTTEPPDRAQILHRRSARLSTLAAAVTAIVLGVGIATGPASDTAWLIFILVFAVPPIGLSVAATLRYRRPLGGTLVEKAAVVVYWVFVAVFWLQGGLVLIPGALLQTAAWYVSRRPLHR